MKRCSPLVFITEIQIEYPCNTTVTRSQPNPGPIASCAIQPIDQHRSWVIEWAFIIRTLVTWDGSGFPSSKTFYLPLKRNNTAAIPRTILGCTQSPSTFNNAMLWRTQEAVESFPWGSQGWQKVKSKKPNEIPKAQVERSCIYQNKLE